MVATRLSPGQPGTSLFAFCPQKRNNGATFCSFPSFNFLANVNLEIVCDMEHHPWEVQKGHCRLRTPLLDGLVGGAQVRPRQPRPARRRICLQVGSVIILFHNVFLASFKVMRLTYKTSEKRQRVNWRTNSIDFADKEGRGGQKLKKLFCRHMWKPPYREQQDLEVRIS